MTANIIREFARAINKHTHTPSVDTIHDLTSSPTTRKDVDDDRSVQLQVVLLPVSRPRHGKNLWQCDFII